MHKTSSSLVRSWLRGLTLALGVLAGSANAATYSGVWDPPFGTPFGDQYSGLGWRGTAEFFVPDTCEPSGTTLVDNYGFLPWIPGNCGGQARVTSARVQLYDVGSSEQDTLATLVFNPNSFVVGVLQYVGGELEGLLSDPSNLVLPASDPLATLADLSILDGFGPLNPYTTQFSLIFTIDNGPRLAWRDCSPLYHSMTSSSSNWCRGGLSSVQDGFRPDFTITRVPEPGSLALVGLALVALPLSRRRGKRSVLQA